MSGDNTQNSQSPEFIREVFSSIATRYDTANHVLSGGIDYYWRRMTARQVRAWNPERILDLATGSGDLAITLKKANPEAWIVGADFCFPMLRQAQKKNLSPLVVADGMQLPFADESFDVVTIAFGLRNMKDWAAALREMARVLRPGGHVAVLDFSLPKPPLRGLYRFYLHHFLPKIAGWITREKSAYEYLGESIEAFPQYEKMCALFEQSGLAKARYQPLTFGVVTLYTGVKN